MIAVRRSAGAAKAFRATATALGDLPDMGEAEPQSPVRSLKPVG